MPPLSPTPRRLLALRRVWDQAITRMRRGEPEETATSIPLEPLADLAAVADADTANDTSVPNGSSIAFLLEHRGASCLLAADAFPTVLGGALWALVNARGGIRFPLTRSSFRTTAARRTSAGSC